VKRDIPERFLTYNAQDSKDISIVVKIDGVSTVYSNRKLYGRIKYGDAGLHYGQAGLVYGGLVEIGDVVDNLLLSGSSLSLDQQINPEDGTGTISQISLQFVDLNQTMTNLCSPGKVIPEIMGAGVTVYLGFKDIAYPDDYIRVFRGYISSVTNQAGKVTFALSDPNIRSKQELAFLGTTKTTVAVLAADTTINVDSTADFQNTVTYPYYNSTIVDTSATLYFKIESEWIQRWWYEGLDPAYLHYVDKFANCIRGARGTTAVDHAINTDVTEGIELDGHPIDLALKLMLSGWGAPFATGVVIEAFNQTSDLSLGIQTNCIVFPEHVDPVRDYGLVENDYVIAVGGLNDGRTWLIDAFSDLGGKKNKLMYVRPKDAGVDVVTEGPAVGTLSFRSQYDLYPIGMRLTPNDVDVAGFQYLRNTFLFQAEYRMRFFITSDMANGKQFLEEQLYKPIGAYSLTRGGKLSLGLTKPPLAQDDLRILTSDNILNPENIAVKRATNNRGFYTRIYYNYDYDDAGNVTNFLRVVDFNAEDIKGGLSSILTVDSQGARSDYQVDTVFTKRGQFILRRYKDCAVSLSVVVLFQVGVLIEAGDVIAIRDDGQLQLASTENGVRDMGFKLFEVVRRALDLKSGRATLTLSAGVGGEATDRYGVISPSSFVAASSTSTEIILKPSFSESTATFERRKWEDHVGEKLLVHSEDYSVSGECTFSALDPSNLNKIIVTGLTFTPLENYIVDVPYYPTAADKNENREYKEIYCAFSPQIPVATGISATSFTVASGKGASFNDQVYIRVHSYDYSVDSGDKLVQGISGDTITCDALGFTPTSSHFVDLIGFADGGSSYRLI